MNKFIKSSIILLIISVFIATGVNALKCYECSDSEPGCEDLFDAKPEFLKECEPVKSSLYDRDPKPANICRKRKGNMNGDAVTVRMCYYVENPSQEIKCVEQEEGAYKGTECGCIEDGCNFGAKIGTNLILSIFTVLFVTFLSY